MMPASSRLLQVFLAEDNRADVYLVELALREHHIRFQLRLVTDGDEAIQAAGRFGAEEQVPDIAILDVNLPRSEGSAVLRAIRAQGCCARTPIILMSSAQKAQHKMLIESFNAVFFEKSPNLPEFMALGALVRKLGGPKVDAL